MTPRGEDVAADERALQTIRAADRLDIDLHPAIAARVRAQFLLGEYEAAAFLAMREVEIQVRAASRRPSPSSLVWGAGQRAERPGASRDPALRVSVGHGSLLREMPVGTTLALFARILTEGEARDAIDAEIAAELEA